ncbi:ABC-type sugar transporter%2C permease protein [Mycobacterium tuberculosis]|nr:ABC-type sugar transporter%2C permease protein [Mycobacterium tuberculosis]
MTHTRQTPAQDDTESVPTTARPASRRRRISVLLGLVERLGLVFLLIGMFVFFAVNPTSGPVFTSSQNLSNLLGDQAVVGLVALAMLLPLIAGYFDLSVAANVGLVNVAVAAVMSRYGWSPLEAMAAGLVLGGVVGLMTGFLVARLNLDAFIVTFGVYIFLNGVTLWYTKGIVITEDIPTSVGAWGSQDWFGIPRPFWLLTVATLATWILVSQTPFGRYLESIGSSESAARLVGIKTDRTIWIAFVTGGLLAGVAGCLLTSRQGGADATVGQSYLFPAIAAIFLGATAIRPSRYNVWGTVIGVYFVAVAVSGLILLGADYWVQPLFNGAILVLAVGMSTASRRARAKREVKEQRTQGNE